MISAKLTLYPNLFFEIFKCPYNLLLVIPVTTNVFYYLFFFICIFYNNNLPCSNKKLKNTLKKLIYNLKKKLIINYAFNIFFLNKLRF